MITKTNYNITPKTSTPVNPHVELIMCLGRGGWSRVIKHQQVSDVTKGLIAQLKMAHIHIVISTLVITGKCSQDTELHELVTVYKLGKLGKRSQSLMD